MRPVEMRGEERGARMACGKAGMVPLNLTVCLAVGLGPAGKLFELADAGADAKRDVDRFGSCATCEDRGPDA
jgi:hypothetical protein